MRESYLNNIVLFFLLFTISCKEVGPVEKNNPFIPLVFEAEVIGIKDGDTYVIFYNGQQRTLRLAHIDCAEKQQPFGISAKEFAARLCLRKKVTIKTKGKTDRYKRIIGELLLADGTNINKELVQNGLAWHFKQYSDDLEYAVLELAARKQHIGIWTQEKPVAPWLWRAK